MQSNSWSGNQKEGKQAEFLMEHSFPWQLVERIGTPSSETYQQVTKALSIANHWPRVDIKPEWYY